MNVPADSWRPSTLIKASFVLHVCALIGLVAQPALWELWLGILVANHALLAVGGLLPRSNLLGPNITRLSPIAEKKRQVAITFDDGPDPKVTTLILDILDIYGAKATFFCIGQQVEMFPEIVQRITQSGHQIENHSYSHHKSFAFQGPKAVASEINRAQQVIAHHTGRSPRFFKPIAGIRNPLLDPILQKTGLKLASWTRRGYDTRCKNPKTVLERLTRNLAPGDILLLHDGGVALTTDGTAVSVACLPLLLEELNHMRLTSVTLDTAFSEQAT